MCSNKSTVFSDDNCGEFVEFSGSKQDMSEVDLGTTDAVVWSSSKINAYHSIMHTQTKKSWKVVESHCQLGYNGQSK